MPALSVRNLSQEAYDRLKRMALRSHRSLQEQVKTILERESLLAAGAPASLKWRDRLKGRAWGDVTSEIRSERSR